MVAQNRDDFSTIFDLSESIFSMFNNHSLHYCGLFISSYITTIQQHGRLYKLQTTSFNWRNWLSTANQIRDHI